MTSLQEKCYQRLAETMMKAPPVLQEIIVGETKEKMKTEVKREVIADIKNLGISDLVSEMVNDMIGPVRDNKNYWEENCAVDPEIISFALNIAEKVYEICVEKQIPRRRSSVWEETDSD